MLRQALRRARRHLHRANRHRGTSSWPSFRIAASFGQHQRRESASLFIQRLRWQRLDRWSGVLVVSEIHQTHGL